MSIINMSSSTAYENRRRVESTYALVSYGFDCTIGRERSRTQAMKRLGGRLHESRATLQALRSSKHTLPRRSIDILMLDLDGLAGAIEDDLNSVQVTQRSEYAASCLDQFRHHQLWSADYDRNKPAVISLITKIENDLDGDPVLAYSICVELSRLLWREFRLSSKRASLVREIRFSPEHRDAGVSILSYFATILEKKLPKSDCTVSILQSADRVVLTIEHPNGHLESVERLLTEYGLAVTRQTSIESFLPNPIDAMALTRKLEIAELELRQNRELLSYQRTAHASRLASVEAEIIFLRSHLGLALESERRIKEDLYKLFRKLDSTTPSAIHEQLVCKLMDAVLLKSQSQSTVELAAFRTENPDLFERLSKYITESAAAGTIGNACYDWLKILWPILPK